MTIETLNARFGKPGLVEFLPGPGGSACARLSFRGSSALLTLLGATVLSYRPEGFGEQLYLSAKSLFEKGKSIRGGIPICLPWFGADPSGSGKPRHGFFRILPWEALGSSVDGDGVSVSLGLKDSDETRSYWPRAFRAECRIRLDSGLSVTVRLENRDGEAFAYSAAFHPYFLFGDIAGVSLPALDGKAYLDSGSAVLGGNEGKARSASAPLVFQGEVERSYDESGPFELVAAAESRRLRISASRASRVVVWTPGQERCAAFPDAEPGDYSRFLCVEPGVIPPDSLSLAPGEGREIGIRLEAGAL